VAGNNATIVIKKIKKGGHGHHGGAWKVAYADFVTAMMAFFLLLWLLNSTTQEQKKGISDYFSPTTVSKSKSGAGGLLGGVTVSSPSAQVSRTSPPGVTINLKPTANEGEGENDDSKSELSQQDVDELIAEREEELFKEKEQELREVIDKDPELKQLAKNLLIDQTPKGLCIQIIDQDGQPMFPTGSARMVERFKKLVHQVTKVVLSMPNKLSISGHTDAMPFRAAQAGYGNWELSSDRAHASRREILQAGMPAARISKVVGRAETEPLTPDNPNDAQNRRISIVLLREAGLAAQKPGSSPGKRADAPAPEFRRDWTGPRVR